MAVDADKYTAQAALEFSNGYFIRAKAGAKTILPIQACMFLAQESLSQNVHNIIIAEKGSELHIYRAAEPQTNSPRHPHRSF